MLKIYVEPFTIELLTEYDKKDFRPPPLDI